jgi:hypothetical protein
VTATPASYLTWADLPPATFGQAPAEALEDCTCKPGFENVDGKSCTQCQKTFYKGVPGNFSCPTCISYKLGSTTLLRGAFQCQCEAGKYMNQAELCADCPIGYYCRGNGVPSQMCPTGKTTVSTGAKLELDCVCSPGYFSGAGGLCEPCAADGLFFKADLGDGACEDPCPLNSKTSIPGARGAENCVCNAGFTQFRNESQASLGQVTCQEALDDLSEPTSIRLPSVSIEFDFAGVSPDELMRCRDRSLCNDSPLRIAVQSALGLADAEKISLQEVGYVPTIPRRLEDANRSGYSNDVEINRRLQLTATPEVTRPPGTTKVLVTVWQSTFVEAENLVPRMNNLDVGAIQASLQTDPRLATLTSLTMPPDKKAAIVFEQKDCPVGTALKFGETFASTEESCRCSYGFELTGLILGTVLGTHTADNPSLSDDRWTDKDAYLAFRAQYGDKVGRTDLNANDIEQLNAAKCHPCKFRSEPFYKDVVEDAVCSISWNSRCTFVSSEYCYHPDG